MRIIGKRSTILRKVGRTTIHGLYLPPRSTELRYQNFVRNRYRDFFSDTKTETKTLKQLAKVSKPKDFKTEMSISAEEEAIAF